MIADSAKVDDPPVDDRELTVQYFEVILLAETLFATLFKMA